MWHVSKAVQYLNDNAKPSSEGYCARYVKRAISAGGDISTWPSIVSAKNYGSALIERGFRVVDVNSGYIAGDVVVIQGIRKSDFPVGEIRKDHPHGHMAMFNGQQWVSDFKQNNGYYPGGDYRKAKPAYVFYRHKDVVGEQPTENKTSANSSMEICFPVRKQDGSQYATLEEMMGLIGREPHGSWLAGVNCLWHGGIHVSQISAPNSVLTAGNVEIAVPLQCMVQGEVVAWRLNKDYLIADYLGKKLRYSSTFVLVKSTCEPDPEKENSWLEFYSLYLGLAPLSAFPKFKCMKAKKTVKMREATKYESSAPAGSMENAPQDKGRQSRLLKDDRVIIFREKTFLNNENKESFGLAKKLDTAGKETGELFWVTLLPEHMEADGEHYAQMPAWMQQAVQQGAFDVVTKPTTALNIEAGDAIGFLGKDIAPTGKSKVDSSHYAHIEVISTDPRMSNFLNNPAQVTHGKKYIQVLSGKSLYQKTGEGKDSTFKSMSCIVLKDGGIILPRDKCNPLEDKDGKTWFEISPHSWIAQADVKELHQYDLKELGFTTLEEDPSPDISKSMSESWVKGAFDWFSKQLGQDRGIQQKQVSTFYNNLVKKIDADGDGEMTGKELYNAVHHPEMGVRDIAARLIVKHDSEWFGGSGHHRWSVFFQNYDPLRIAYAKQWLDDMEWMSKVDAFKSGAPVWHLHPVMFLAAIKARANWFDIEKFIVKYKEQHHSIFGFYDNGNKISISKLNQESEDSLRALLNEMKGQYYNYFDSFNEKFVSYMLATVRIESYDFMRAVFFKPISENISYDKAERDYGSGPTGTNKQRAILNHNTSIGDGYKYRGRGLVQLTWKINYEKFMGITGANIVINPDLCHEIGTAVSIMMNGMKDGGFRAGNTLDSYLGAGKKDYYNARLIINGYSNGIPDKANEFKDYAELFEVIINETR
ncbi:hypothetical protein [Yersinia mollaretii]|uniref:Endolysin n=1 Tax=Yersinia mollaretii TaxID=33060 RepID=A0AA36LLU5_YERMO|nr:hypothetical protein [Yersinia mollaretii]MDA5525622.1 hypothetical protein [Yersinia mollaretii]MDR7871723.1 hypothetical protein [Yersinia mollaretii]PHZ29903.1 hypothetical protein CS537_20275 [Yersinia mollaretii]WQC73727.1 hypothetical protein U1Z61_14910 [Yersinia mollaretii]CNE05835.1 putative endolysin [Yersinia mollaretii]